jgi:hypothetical protein
MTWLYFILIMLIIVFLVFAIAYYNPKKVELEPTIKREPRHPNYSIFKLRCPNLLIQKDSRFYLHNTKLAEVPGVNPIEFNNLEDYTEFLDWQRSQGIRCPILYLQHSYDAQGTSVYKARPNPLYPQGGLPPSDKMPVSIASSGEIIMESPETDTNLQYPNPTQLVDATRSDPPYNKNSYPSYDETSYYIGTTTPLDLLDIQQENAQISPNPMDPNWGGADYTQKLVESGYYKDNEVLAQPH